MFSRQRRALNPLPDRRRVHYILDPERVGFEQICLCQAENAGVSEDVVYAPRTSTGRNIDNDTPYVSYDSARGLPNSLLKAFLMFGRNVVVFPPLLTSF